MTTDFERYGLATHILQPVDRSWLVTIDFEGFRHDSLELWLAGMERWSELSKREGLQFSIFIALEDVVRLRHDDPDGYGDFIAAARALGANGSLFYPHNHGIFDLETGRQAADRPERIDGYAKRASFFYDVVHRHRMDLGAWVMSLREPYLSFLEDCGGRLPTRSAFRAGGWDHGATADESRRYVEAIAAAGFAFDSSASSGVFGTRSWRIGAPFGSNIFAMQAPVVEVASCWSLDCDASLLSKHTARSVLELVAQPRVWASRRTTGALVTVLHFDHLFRPPSSRGTVRRAISPAVALDRVERFFKVMSRVREVLNLQSITFEDLGPLRVG
jgi:hypothetical protein